MSDPASPALDAPRPPASPPSSTVLPTSARHRILPGEGPVEAILALPAGLEIEQIHRALNDVKQQGWVLDVESYSRLRGPYHHFGLTRSADLPDQSNKTNRAPGHNASAAKDAR